MYRAFRAPLHLIGQPTEIWARRIGPLSLQEEAAQQALEKGKRAESGPLRETRSSQLRTAPRLRRGAAAPSAELAEAARAPGQAAAGAAGASRTADASDAGDEPESEAAAADRTAAAASAADAGAAPATDAHATMAAAAAMAAAVTAAAATAGQLHAAAAADVFPVEEIERGKTDVRHFLFAENETLVRRDIVGLREVGAGQCGSGCASHQRKTQSGGTQRSDGTGFGRAFPLRSLLDLWHGRILREFLLG